MSATDKPATLADIRRVLGDIDDVTVAEIAKLKPTIADLDEALMWLSEGDDVPVISGGPQRPVAAAIVDMLAVEEEEAEEQTRT
ncbi:MAG: hypothetical protein KIT36_01465 [Alphaproteobacteria bacterium]|nr:hypothetical protein [Alphaproteobacteria bacterium]